MNEYLDRNVSVTCYTAQLLHTNITLKYRLCVGQRNLYIETKADERKGVLEPKNTDFSKQKLSDFPPPTSLPTTPIVLQRIRPSRRVLSTRTSPKIMYDEQMLNCHETFVWE